MSEHERHHQQHRRNGDSPYDDPFLRCCCCPFCIVTSFVSGLNACISATVYPLLRCFGLADSDRHHHHHHHNHTHFN